jgi:hypothetical protein
VTLFRKAKLKHHGIMPTRSRHVAKQQYWRRVKVIENIDLEDEQIDIENNGSSYFDRKQAENEEQHNKGKGNLYV